MDDRQFDRLVKSVASTRSRRGLLRLMAVVAVTGCALGEAVQGDAARRGYSGPASTAVPTPPPDPGQTTQCFAPSVYCAIEGGCCAGGAACIPPFGCICGGDYSLPCPIDFGYCDPTTHKCVRF